MNILSPSMAGCAFLLMISPVAGADLEEAFQTELRTLLVETSIPGITAAYVLPDGAAHSFAAGWSDIERGVAMTPASRMPAASIGKTYLGALAVSLAAEGVLDLDAPVAPALRSRAWFNRLPHHQQITLRHLLNHTSGLADHVYTDAFAADVARRWHEENNPFLPEVLVAYLFDLPARFAPGDGWAYSDTGYILAGMVIEAFTRSSCYDEITRRFLVPLALTGTIPADRRTLPGLAAGYTHPGNRLGLPPKTLDETGRLTWHPGMEGMGGGWITTAGDLAQWGHALFVGAALSPSARRNLLQSVAVDPHGGDVRYGAGVAVRADGRHGPTLGHGGWIPGYCSSLRHYTDHGITLAIQINTDIGLVKDDADVVATIEHRLASVVLAHLRAERSGR